ncbi:class I SAM-dependent methyltransferase [Oceanobacillus profundus]|uniref:Methyltransferase domain-containing protein n=1 Tax=Oceanobacillus profundus TaxID=372463 RepID=A0A417YM91_9BACI|nr:class I SAM-dependent methyltransferase [Oceanobacillus profundus]MCM3400148.1 class I SAM-dependent methyltransferase [Oceanobacillus profundus]MDO6449041.1 class I SAM-dependent methyltransferase [Oceanobacillus profundus]PAE29669.1 16S rRNA (cytosine(1402)-N(4))-methyltransferase [Paenibacillus sp. 7884-2]RHW34616.1 methyltransferase domain-containing protein [Oceanobacillus profundus]
MLKGILNYAHYLLEETIQSGEKVIDATCGNGNDTLFFSKLVGENGHVYAFDIQDQAIANTRKVLINNNCSNVSLIHDSHERILDYFPKDKNEEIAGAIFNLGYLPRSDKTVITTPDSTVTAVDAILNRLKKDGLVVLVVYHGHEGGKEEKEGLLKYLLQLDQKQFNVLRYGFINQKNDPPFILAIQKKVLKLK